MSEIWKDVKGYEGQYQVSNIGRVKSVDRLDASGHHRKEKILQPTLDKDSYYKYGLYKNGQRKTFHTHTLVAQAFIPNPENKPCIDHINTDRTDNTVWLNEDGSVDYEKTNLRWCTNKENHNNPLSLINHCKASSIPVLQFTKQGVFIKKYNSATEVANTIKISPQHISGCCKGRYGFKSAGGFVWKYYKGFFLGVMIYSIRTRVD